MLRKIVDYEVAWRIADDTPCVYIRPEGSQQMVPLPVSDNPTEAHLVITLLQGEKDLFWDDQTQNIQTYVN